MPYVVYTNSVQKFIDVAYEQGWILESFDWVTWGQTDEGQNLLNCAAAIRSANAEQLLKILTFFIRRERFAEATLLYAINFGLMLAVVQRRCALANQAGRPVAQTLGRQRQARLT